jgi:hypothetical protein
MYVNSTGQLGWKLVPVMVIVMSSLPAMAVVCDSDVIEGSGPAGGGVGGGVETTGVELVGMVNDRVDDVPHAIQASIRNPRIVGLLICLFP